MDAWAEKEAHKYLILWRTQREKDKTATYELGFSRKEKIGGGGGEGEGVGEENPGRA